MTRRLVDVGGTSLVKLALRRDNTVPVGQPAPLHVVCPCGQSIPIRADLNCCGCGRIVDAAGWLVSAQREPTRTREHGTEVTQTSTGDQRIAAIRRIVERKQYAKVDGVMVDLFSASAIVQVFDAISEANRAKFTALPVAKMADVAFKVIKKAGG